MLIAVDFDGTIVQHRYPKIGAPIPFAIETLLRLQKEKHQLVLWTVREGKLLDEAVNYCRERGLVFYAVNKTHPEEDPTKVPRKLMVDLFIDDLNLGGLPDWGMIYKIISSGNTYTSAAGTSFSGDIEAEKNKKKKKIFGWF